MHAKRPEGPPYSGASKSPFLKNCPPSDSDTAVQEPNKTKALASMFANSQEETNKPFIRHKLQSKPSFTQTPEPKTPQSKARSDPAPVFPKPTVTSAKPTWVKEDSTPSASPAVPKVPPAQLKPNNVFFKLQQQMEARVEEAAETASKPAFPVNAPPKPSNFKSAHGVFNKEPQPDSGAKPSVVNKLPLNGCLSAPPPKPHPSKKPSLRKSSPDVNDHDPATPKRNPLTNSLALGPAPAKPNRPPNVNLAAFRKEPETCAEGHRKTTAPPPPPHPVHNGNHVTPVPIAVPSLPPRHPGAINQTEEVYDDVDGPPPLPPVHPSQMSKVTAESDDEDGEMYEDLDERWEAAESEEKKKEKDNKEEKKRVEAEKKEQREREKKEQEARRKFKLVGPLEVLQKGKARVDSKGSKTDLGLKQGDSLDIIRIQDNPEGKWLGRTQDGSVGFVKITSVEIDFKSLKQQMTEQAFETEVYDDIETTPTALSKTKGGVVVPLPEPEPEIYDDVDQRLNVRLPPPGLITGDSDLRGGVIDEEIYDDVDSHSLPPPLPTTRVDPKKQKKMEKEEKEFRKKFKYEGEIKVLHQLTIVPNLTNKRWNSKELPLKAGEKLDVIVEAVENKFICRNEDGKYGYVSTSYVVADDGDIYDDIGDDSIYDND